MPAFRNQKNSENSFSFSAFCQFNDVILYTSRGMMPTNQFKVHGQLPLHGMTVSALSPPLQVLLAAVPSLSLPAELSFSSPQPRFQRLLVLLPISGGGGAAPDPPALSWVFFFFWEGFFCLFSFFLCWPVFLLQIRESEDEWGVPHAFTLVGQQQSVVVAAR